MSYRPNKPRAAGSAHDATARFVDQCGGTRAVSDFIGRSPSTVNGWTDPDGRDGASGIGFVHACMLTEHFGTPTLAEHLALRAGGVFLPLAPREGDTLGELTADMVIGAAETAAAIMRARDGASEAGAALSTAEAREVLAKLDPLIRVTGLLYTEAKRASEPEARS